MLSDRFLLRFDLVVERLPLWGTSKADRASFFSRRFVGVSLSVGLWLADYHRVST
jgi:hypothetical protein